MIFVPSLSIPHETVLAERQHRGARWCARVIAAAALLAVAGPAAADFRLCNNTGSRVGIAVGYKEGETWTTEGWWNLSSRTCETLLRGTLSSRFYYIYAVDYDRGGEWSGKALMCTRDKEFTIRGVEDCLARGFERTGFFEVDTGEQQSWTVQLTESTDQAPSRPLQPQPSATPEAGGGGRDTGGRDRGSPYLPASPFEPSGSAR
ncbi:MAG: DUF1036 domain-containing protein [Variibacter sp.]|nr:DUF1036 domain-containing protein [Variibacter sp.]